VLIVRNYSFTVTAAWLKKHDNNSFLDTGYLSPQGKKVDVEAIQLGPSNDANLEKKKSFFLLCSVHRASRYNSCK
jgi:hypothetical protein